MNPQNDATEIVFESPTNYSAFTWILQECAGSLGPRFAVSIANWCGIGERPYPLRTWRIFIAYARNEEMGICSYYQEPTDDAQTFWLGWLAVRPHFRCQGAGARMITFILSEITKLGGTTACVFTDQDNIQAISLYRQLGFEVVGQLSPTESIQASAGADSLLLRKQIGSTDHVDQPHAQPFWL
jgi:ribosomal protein S18 acetylase RimI-like enzyme